MIWLDLTPETMDRAVDAIPPGSPVIMLNLLRFRDRAEYPGEAELGLAPCSGRDAYYGRYIPEFLRLAAGMPVRPAYLGAAAAHLVCAEGESWDVVALVEYPDFATFRKVVDTAEYRATAEPHRLASLADWRLIATTPFELPG